MPSADELGVISVFFNPCGYKSRIRNYARFRENLGNVRLLTLELCFGETEAELAYPEVTVLRGGDIMWQKSRLINIGISQLLAQGYKKIAWLDADIVFDHENWFNKVSKALDEYAVVQCFDRCRRAFSDGTLDGLSAVYAAEKGKQRAGGTGLAWAAHADVLRDVELYQHCIIGGDDDAWYLACMNNASDIKRVIRDRENQGLFAHVSQNFRSHYIEWAEKCAAIVDQNVGYVAQTVFAYPHGRLHERYYAIRQGILRYFDPYMDVKFDAEGPLYWSSDKPELHNKIAEYFHYRNEDA